MEIFVALAVIVIILLGALIMTLARLAAAAATISSGVARIGIEVSETAAAIRAHLEGDSGISQSALLEQVEKLEAAGAGLTSAADALDSLQTDLGANAGAGGEEPAVNPPQRLEPVPAPAAGDAPDLGSNAGGTEGESFGNQNGIGSEFETGDGDGAINGNDGGDQLDGEPPASNEAHDAAVESGEEFSDEA